MTKGSIVRLGLAGVVGLAFIGCNALTGQVRVNGADAGDDDGVGSVGAAVASEDDPVGEDGVDGAEVETPCPSGDFVSPDGLPTGVVTIGEHVFHVELAATREDQIRGLMERESLARDAGMLFIFDEPRMQAFWMMDTPLALDIAFIREDLTISSIDTMEPLTTTLHPSTEPVPYVLEVPAGEFASRGIQPGDVISITTEK